ncbi:MAG TPA: FtsX-like permease family protein [Puia sp.]
MITHFKIALRNLRKYPVFSSINLIGLSVGIAASFVLLVYAKREMSTDSHFQDADRIARIGTDFFNMGGFAESQPGLGNMLKSTCKDVAYATSFYKDYGEEEVRTSLNERAYTGIHPYHIDASFFKVFSYGAAEGAIPLKGLSPGEAILSETNSRRLFGQASPIGRTILIGKENAPFKVVAVLKEVFERSHLDPSLLLPLSITEVPPYPTVWANCTMYNYIKLQPGGSLAGVKATLDKVLKKVVNPDYAYMHVLFIIQPLRDIYFHSSLNLELSPGGSLTQVRLLSAIGVFLILLAIINYVNLVTARSSTRHKEFGLKKTLGASRYQLAGQIVLESLLFSLLAMLLSCGLIQVITFLYRHFTGDSLTNTLPLMLTHYAWLLLFSLGVGLIAGLYPAIYLTAIKPILSLRSMIGRPGKSSPRVRNVLVLVQFSVAAALVFASFVVYSQLQYINDKDKGLKAEGVLLVDKFRNQDAFRHLIEQQSQVVSTSFCNRTPAGQTIWVNTYQTAAMSSNMSIQSFPVDDRFLTTMGMRLVEGRNFNRDLITDTNSLILNESAVAALGLFDPLGSSLNGSEHVIGVVKDFNYNSLHEKIAPAILRYSPQGNILAIRVRGGHTAQFLEWLQAAGKKFMPDDPLTVTFLDDNFKQLAKKDKLLGNAIGFFTMLAIFLATLGLTGLTLFTIERRTREIGVRKVLGATIPDILTLVSKDFVRLTFVASGIALPLSWWLVHRWLNNFAYRVSIGWWIFFVTEAILLLIALSVISLLALKAATVNPVKTLRTE